MTINNIERKYAVDGAEYFASSAQALVRQMNEASFSQRPTAHEFMTEVAERTTLQNGAKPRTDTFEHFVADLILAGMIKEIS